MEFHVKTIRDFELPKPEPKGVSGSAALRRWSQLVVFKRTGIAYVFLLFSIGVSNAGECPLLVEPDEITVNTPVTANWTSVLVCPSEPAVEISGSVVTVDFNFGYCPGVLPPGFCGDNRAEIGRLPPGTYTLVAIGHGWQRSVGFEVLPVAVDTLDTVGKFTAMLMFLCLALLWLKSDLRRRTQAGFA